VSLVVNADRKTMGKAVDQFVGKLGTGDVAFFYYSGHGAQDENSENYLIPVDYQGQSETALRYDAHPAGRIQERMERSGAQLNILVLDACRNNPYHSASRAGSGGLAAMSPSRGTFIAFATAPGHTASDNPNGRNGLFTQYLLEAIAAPGLSLNDVFDLVREKVDAASGGKQLPWTLSSVVGRFSFVPTSSATGRAPSTAPAPVVHAPLPQRSCVSPPAGLVGWWPGDAGENDIIGGNNASGMNSVQLRAAQVRSGFGFGPQGGYVEIPGAASLANQEFTWTAWVMPEGPGPRNDRNGSVILNQVTNGHNFLQLSWSAASNHFVFVFGEESREFLISKDEFPPGVFYLVTGTYDGSAFRLFVNGVEQSSFPETKMIQYSSSGWHFGGNPTMSLRTWNGVIDEVQAFNRALSPSEIQAIYTAGSAGECKPSMP
jgi:hypothetical protein